MRDINHNARITMATLLALVLGAYLFSADARAEDSRGDISRVNSRVEVQEGRQTADVSTDNGRIDIGREVSANRVKTVNGSIDSGGSSTVTCARTVNGGIRVDSDTIVGGRLSTVNGDIHVQENVIISGPVVSANGSVNLGGGSSVQGLVRAENGDIRLTNATAGGDLAGRNGDIHLQQRSHVQGDIIIRKKRHWWNGSSLSGKHSDPKISVDSSSSIKGNIHLYRKVELEIADGALAGEIIQHY